ncbi:hypothetical protein OH685_12345 [Acinetobacter pittii]|nr:hypothetical protein OH685_12345 [Acinetobacter pittii]
MKSTFFRSVLDGLLRKVNKSLRDKKILKKDSEIINISQRRNRIKDDNITY